MFSRLEELFSLTLQEDKLEALLRVEDSNNDFCIRMVYIEWLQMDHRHILVDLELITYLPFQDHELVGLLFRKDYSCNQVLDMELRE